MKAALCLALIAAVAGTEVTPIQKVLELMGGMLEKGKKEKHDEQVQFASFKQFCDDTTTEKQTAIADAEEQIEVLKADIQKFAADIELLNKEIAGHEEDISVWEGDEKAATIVRGLEKADYDALHKDLTESIEAVEMAIAVLKKQPSTVPQGASLMQVADRLQSSSMIPAEAKRALDAFFQQDPDVGLGMIQAGAPEAAAYENRSGGVVAMLEKLLTEFTAERTKVEKEEMSNVNAFEMMMSDLKAQVEEAKDDVSAKSQTRAKRKQGMAQAEADLADTTAAMEADKKYLADLTATCAQKTSDFEARQALRAEELEAIEKAMEIVSSGAVAGAGEKHLPGLLQTTSLAQLRADARSPNQDRVVQYLEDKSRQLNSRILSMLAVRAADDPFKKVKKMIQDLIYRLMEEANAEASQKGWCDEELSTNAHTRKEKSKEVDTLITEIDALEAEIAELTEDIMTLTDGIAKLDAAMTKASELREEEKTKNTQTIADAQAAQTAVAQALTVLKEFYAKAAEATALLQQRQEPPPMPEEPYKGMGGEAGGVVGMLEVIESDFARLESETKAAEAAAQEEYDEFMHDSEMDKTSKEKDVEHKTIKKQDDNEALVTAKDDLESAKKELTAAMKYFDKLKPSCVDSGVSYEERVKQRKAEIESLQEALKILSGDAIA